MTFKEIQKINRLEEVKGHYYSIPEDVYNWIPLEYKEKQGLSFKRIIGIGISLWIFIGTIMEFMKPDVSAEYRWASIPLFVMALLIFALCASPHVHVDPDSQIIEATVRKVEKYNLHFVGRKYVVSVVTLFVPSMNREIKAHIESAPEGTHIVIVKKKDYHFFVRMNEYYVPKYMSEENGGYEWKN